MSRYRLLLTAVLGTFAAGISAPAATWCSVNAPGAVFCDDFDRYCPNPPPAPEACASGSGVDSDTFWQTWNFSFRPCSLLTMGDAFYDSPPYAARTPNQDGAQTTHAGVNLSPFIRSKYGNEYNAMLGTDQTPLTLEYSFHGQTGGKVQYANSFMEIARGASQAAVDYVLSPNCSSCGGENRRYPVICQQLPTPAGCPPLSTATHWASLAVGAVTYLDTDPCHCSGSEHSPSNPRLSFFDGYQWFILRQGRFPGGGSGDFLLRNNLNRIRLTIRDTSVKVELTCPGQNPAEYSWCEIPRDYQGSFDHLYIGLRAPCRLKTGEWVCDDLYECIKGAPGGGVPTYDNVAAAGGVGATGTAGACCFPDTTCTSTLGALECQSRGGLRFAGPGTLCGQVACCPPLRPDHDMDGDVDLVDFGWLQLCLPGTGTAPSSLPCTCADLNDDTRVDMSDVDLFIRCLSGSGVAANGGCLN